MNAEVQTRARRINKSLNYQLKEIEENNRMRKTRDLFKKIGGIRRKPYVRMGTTVRTEATCLASS